MYNADQRSMEFINSMHEFIDAVKKHKHDGFFCYPCRISENEKDYSSTRTIHSHLFKIVSCPTTMFGSSMEKEGLYWRMMRLRMITRGPSLKILQWVSLKKMLKHRLQKMISVRCCMK
jgi:hypothetical protein